VSQATPSQAHRYQLCLQDGRLPQEDAPLTCEERLAHLRYQSRLPVLSFRMAVNKSPFSMYLRQMRWFPQLNAPQTWSILIRSLPHAQARQFAMQRTCRSLQSSRPGMHAQTPDRVASAAAATGQMDDSDRKTETHSVIMSVWCSVWLAPRNWTMLPSRQDLSSTTSRWNSACCCGVACVGKIFTATGCTPSLSALYT